MFNIEKKNANLIFCQLCVPILWHLQHFQFKKLHTLKKKKKYWKSHINGEDKRKLGMTDELQTCREKNRGKQHVDA
jgi:hypothetical protein